MTPKQITVALCGALALVACSHSKTHESTTARTVTNEEVRESAQADIRPDTMSGRKAVTTCQYTVRFAPESAVLDVAAEKELASAAECMKQHDVDQTLVLGHDDPTTKGHDEDLNSERARAVSEYLYKLGVSDREIRMRKEGQMATASESVDIMPAERTENITGQ